jgi:Fe-S cluster assembly protein SufD
MTTAPKPTNGEGSVESLCRGGLGPGPAWLQSARQRARTRLGELGFPTTEQEEWRFTNPAPLLQLRLRAPDAARRLGPEDIKPFRLGGGYCLVFEDGKFRRDLSTLPANGAPLRAGGLREEIEAGGGGLEGRLARHANGDGQFFTALNTALFADGAFVSVAAGATVEEPVQLLYLTMAGEPGAAAHPRNLVVIHGGAALKVVESYASLGGAACLTNAVTELSLGAGSRLEHCRLQNENQSGFHFAAVQAVQERDSHWLSHSIATGARLARVEIQAALNAEGAEAVLNGLYLARGTQLIDHHTVVDHARPRCESHEFYRGILSGHSHGVFNGKIFVRPDAQKTNAKQTNRNLVLSEDATIDTKPQLEIFADDVKCTHGATVGQLDDEALFYLRARGIGEKEARRMLIRAFAGDAVGRITIGAVREQLEQLLDARLEGLDREGGATQRPGNAI